MVLKLNCTVLIMNHQIISLYTTSLIHLIFFSQPWFFFETPQKLKVKKLYKSFEPTVSKRHKKQIFNASIPYFGDYSERLAEKLSVLLSNFDLHFDFVLLQVNRHIIGSFLNYKWRLLTLLLSSLVQEFSCIRCAY